MSIVLRDSLLTVTIVLHVLLELGSAHAQALPNAREIARLGALRFASGGGVDPADLMPLYLRDKVALTEAERA